jgi:hypothetical protein
MKARHLPDEVRRFILTSVPSVPYLEAILLMRTDRVTPWDAPLVARRLYVPEKTAADLLAQLEQGGVARTGAEARLYHYAPASDELAQRLDDLAKAYADDLLAVTDLIHSRIDKRAHQFADAFRLRKDS